MHTAFTSLRQPFASFQVASCFVVLTGAVLIILPIGRRGPPSRQTESRLTALTNAQSFAAMSGVGRTARRSTAGFTLPELIGSIIVIGIIPSVSAVQVLNVNAQAREFAKYSVTQTVNRISVSAIVGGANVGAGATNNIDTATNLTAIAKLNAGFTAGRITYVMNPNVKTPASYPFRGSPTATNVVFTYTIGGRALP